MQHQICVITQSENCDKIEKNRQYAWWTGGYSTDILISLMCSSTEVVNFAGMRQKHREIRDVRQDICVLERFKWGCS